jgi:DNA-binding NtrC family response regulator
VTRERAAGQTGTSIGIAGPTWHGAVTEFKRRLLENALEETGGNRTRAARRLGLQRTYLLRLIRQLGVAASSAGRGGHGQGTHAGSKPER